MITRTIYVQDLSSGTVLLSLIHDSWGLLFMTTIPTILVIPDFLVDFLIIVGDIDNFLIFLVILDITDFFVDSVPLCDTLGSVTVDGHHSSYFWLLS